MDVIRIKQSQLKQLKMTILAIVMVAASAFILFLDMGSLLITLVGAVGVLFFGACLLYICYRLLCPKDILVLEPRGFHESSSALSTRFVHWSEVAEIAPYDLMSESFIAVWLIDPQRFLDILPPAKRKLIQVNMKMNYPPILITLNSAKEPVAEVVQKMKEYHAAATAQRR